MKNKIRETDKTFDLSRFASKVFSYYSMKKNKTGFSLVEIVIASAIIVTVSVTIFAAYVLVSKYALKTSEDLKASTLLEEGAEALKLMRDFGYTNNISSLTNGTTYRFDFATTPYNSFKSTTTLAFISGKFDRTFVLSSVSRDASHNIVSSGGTVDSGSKLATVTVSWRDSSATTSRSLQTYIFNTFGN